jgi:hypothetical protein
MKTSCLDTIEDLSLDLPVQPVHRSLILQVTYESVPATV